RDHPFLLSLLAEIPNRLSGCLLDRVGIHRLLAHRAEYRVAELLDLLCGNTELLGGSHVGVAERLREREAERVVGRGKHVRAPTSRGELVNVGLRRVRVSGRTRRAASSEQRHVGTNTADRARPPGALENLGRFLVAKGAIEALALPPPGAELRVVHE